MRTESVSPPSIWPEHNPHSHSIEIKIIALTPIFRGGSQPTKIDEGRPFRVPSIRGALRFWWRATSTINDVNRLRQREREIFGGVFQDNPSASLVSISVTNQQSTPGPRPRDKPYAFGVTGNVNADINQQMHNNATVQLRIEWRQNEVREEILRALRAWLLFGGIGGRSRRGAGSVWSPDLTPSGLPATLTIDSYIAAARSLSISPPSSPQFPTFTREAVFIGPACATQDAAWNEGLNRMRDIRASQGVSDGFRRFRRPDLREWKDRDYVLFRDRRRFQSTRAALGLPIRFQSVNFNAVLTSSDNRFPSPVLLKVVHIGDKHHPVYICLRGPTPQNLSIHVQGTRVDGVLDPSGLDHFIALADRLPNWKRHDL